MFMIKFLRVAARFILILMLLVMLLVNIAKFDLINLIILTITFVTAFLLYKNKNNIKIPGKLNLIISGILLVVGLTIRLYLIYTTEFNLQSDFKLYYDTAISILHNKPFNDSWYLSFNGYVYIFSFVISIFLKLFGESVSSVLIFNLLCQVVTVIFLKKMLSKSISKPYSYLFSAIWFIMPNVIAANLLVSTENLFIMLLVIFLYCFCTLRKENDFNLNNILKFILVGILLSFTNNIRPVMLIFLIAVIIDYLVNSRKLKYGILLLAFIGTFFLANLSFSKLVSKGINEPIRSGALSWSLYFGSNYSNNGNWNEPDAVEALDLLKREEGNKTLQKKVVERYCNMGPIKTLQLFSKKYYYFWSDLNGNVNFLFYEIDNVPSYFTNRNLKYVSFTITLSFIIMAIYNLIKKIKADEYGIFVIEIFFIGYILANLLVVLNGRYNYPGILLIIILAGCFSKNIENLKE